MKLYLGNMPLSTGEDDLRDLLANYAPIEYVHLPLDQETRKPRGFAFVTFGSKESAQRVVAELDGQDFGGRPLRISEARENPKSGRAGQGNSTPQKNNDKRPRPETNKAVQSPDSRPNYNDWDREDRSRRSDKGSKGGGKKKSKGHQDNRRTNKGDDWGW